ncbi:hypothetical protein Sjap_025122 [Stephania japonica]|uniref:F-box domain-containing protein n=1 Tax=Stephania japonica TaxID=461633 RepID=A0AAP0E196_9MAGN
MDAPQRHSYALLWAPPPPNPLCRSKSEPRMHTLHPLIRPRPRPGFRTPPPLPRSKSAPGNLCTANAYAPPPPPRLLSGFFISSNSQGRFWGRAGERYIPMGPISNILSRLPLKSLVKFSIVCKAWNELIIHDRKFQELHFSRVKDDDVPYFVYDCIGGLYLLHSDYALTSMILRKVEFEGSPANVVSSCNGLTCLANNRGRFWTCPRAIWNPLTGKSLMLTEPTNILKPSYFHLCGFCNVEPSSNDYKVMWTAKIIKDSKCITEVYEFTSRAWRTLPQTDYQLAKPFGTFIPVVVQGALHWISSRGPTGLLTSFDLASEEFKESNLPMFRFDGCDSKLYCFQDHRLGFLFDDRENNQLDLWLTEDYNDHSKWAKQYILKRQLLNNDLQSFRLLHIFTSNGNILLAFTKNYQDSHTRQPLTGYSLGIYDPRKEYINVAKPYGDRFPLELGVEEIGFDDEEELKLQLDIPNGELKEIKNYGTSMGHRCQLTRREQHQQGAGSANMSCWPNQHAPDVHSAQAGELSDQPAGPARRRSVTISELAAHFFFDFVPDLSYIGVGGVIRDHFGVVVHGAFSHKIQGNFTVEVAELLAIREGLLLANQAQLCVIEVEGDAKASIDLIRQVDTECYLGELIDDIHGLLQ